MTLLLMLVPAAVAKALLPVLLPLLGNTAGFAIFLLVESPADSG